MICGACANESLLQCECGATLVQDRVFGTHARLDPNAMSTKAERDDKLATAHKDLDDKERRVIARLAKRIRYSYSDPVRFVNEYLHRVITLRNAFHVAEVSPPALLDELLRLGSDAYTAHCENRPFEYGIVRDRLNVVDSVQLDPGCDFALALIRLWLDTDSQAKPK